MTDPITSTDVSTDHPTQASARIERTRASCPIDPGFAPLRLLAGESSEEFGALSKALVAHFNPQNVVEKMLLSDVMHNEWELRRCRKTNASAISAARPWSLSRMIGHKDERFIASPLPTGRYQEAIQELASKGYSEADLNAYSALSFASAFESLDKRAATLELRRNQALAALEDYRVRRDEAARTIDVDALDTPTISMTSDN